MDKCLSLPIDSAFQRIFVLFLRTPLWSSILVFILTQTISQSDGRARDPCLMLRRDELQLKVFPPPLDESLELKL